MSNPRRDRRVVALLVASLTVIAGCSGDGRELPPARDPLPATTTTPPTSTALLSELPTITAPSAAAVVTSLPVSGAAIVIDELTSSEPAIAQASGTGARMGDPVTVDGLPADVVTFEVSPDGEFDVRLFVEDEGAHTVCVGDACGRVFTLAPGAETPEDVVAKIDEALATANALVAFDELFPEWSVGIGDPLAGIGGTVDTENREITIYRNRGRSVDDFVRSIVHEYGHVADHDWLDDDRRSTFSALRGFTDDTPWPGEGGHRFDDWVASPSEDFAEAIASWWTDGRWSVRTSGGALTPEQHRFLESLAERS